MEKLHFSELENGEEITTEKLAVMIGKGFAHVDARFNEIDTRFGEIDTRFGEIDTRFGEIDTRFGEVNTRLDNLDARVGRIQADVHDLREEIVYRHEFEDVLGRVKYLERKLGIESGV